jgi:hypothetical protein
MTEGIHEFALSPQGQMRREEILKAAKEAAHVRRRWRVAGRAAAAMCVGAGLMIGVRRAMVHPSAGPAPVARAERAQPPPAVASPGVKAIVFVGRRPTPGPGEVTIGRVATDRTLTERLAVPREAPTWQRLSDEQLLQRLGDAGRPAGLAYVEGRRALILYRQKAAQQ